MHKLGGCWISTAYEQEPFDIGAKELPYAVAFDPEVFKYVVLKLLIESGVDLLLHTYAVKAVMNKDQIMGVIVKNKGGRSAILGKIVVDATGDGDIAHSAGVPFMQAPRDDPHLMNADLMLRIANSPSDFGVPAGGNTVVIWGPNTKLNGTDPIQLTEAELEFRMKVMDFMNDLRQQKA